ncbi:radical SAM protein [Candidatus Micrarchaeota archaeon]|nr:radical SAM protein [Candidatus Micrarchaeota archaeon]
MDEHFGWNERLLPSVIFTEQEKRDAVFADMVCRLYGLVKLYGEDGRKFMEELMAGECGERAFLKAQFEEIRTLPLEALERMAEIYRKKSLLIFALNLTGECQMNCRICYTDRRKRKDELEWKEIEGLLDQAKEMGTKTVYVAGEGEPLLDRNFMRVASWCRENGLKFHVFSNGLALSRVEDAEEFCRRNRLDPKELLRKHLVSDVRVAVIKELEDYPIYFYFKLWSTDPGIHRRMTGIKEQHDHEWGRLYTEDGRGIKVPRGLEMRTAYSFWKE